ncbi:protein ANTAGONIST OF LIKE HETEROCHROMATIN PROTEIN 1-like [Aphis craccivora]|uniref:Protein ANTAGONIST OF LIKE HETEROCHROMATIN PROTEIN 1-like n=1 Tax=Aphis craccivora TaxID=307492 RepID=A0A6G0Z7S1_APHCR|nr:protein ANTAGONIST OF LIKE HETEROCHROMATIN PROTEIN 1-like [Aphis craccivora]
MQKKILFKLSNYAYKDFGKEPIRKIIKDNFDHSKYGLQDATDYEHQSPRPLYINVVYVTRPRHVATIKLLFLASYYSHIVSSVSNLFECAIKFRQYFRINYEQFNFLLSLVEEKLSVESTNRVKNPILPAEKHDSVTIRYINNEGFKKKTHTNIIPTTIQLSEPPHHSEVINLICYIFTQILTLKSDSEAIKSSSSRVAEEAVGQTVRVVVVVTNLIKY